jgi:predicted ATPase
MPPILHDKQVTNHNSAALSAISGMRDGTEELTMHAASFLQTLTTGSLFSPA